MSFSTKALIFIAFLCCLLVIGVWLNLIHVDVSIGDRHWTAGGPSQSGDVGFSWSWLTGTKH